MNKPTSQRNIPPKTNPENFHLQNLSPTAVQKCNPSWTIWKYIYNYSYYLMRFLVKFTLTKMGPFTSFLNGVMTVILPINGLKNGTFMRHISPMGNHETQSPPRSAQTSRHLQLWTTWNGELRLPSLQGTAGGGTPRIGRQEVAGRNAMRFHKTRMDGTANMCCWFLWSIYVFVLVGAFGLGWFRAKV